MTKKSDPGSKLSSTEEAVRMIENAKRRKAGLPPVGPDEVKALVSDLGDALPKRRGRPPGSGAKQQASAPAEDRPSASSVSQLTAHTPLGLIEVQESSDLDALLADKTLAPLIALRLDERFALVLPGSSDRLLTALRKAGHTPRVEDRA